jgi:polyisoprenoid-binding protein YceI
MAKESLEASAPSVYEVRSACARATPIRASAALMSVLLTSRVGDARLSKSRADSVAHCRATGPAGMTIDGNTRDVAVSDDGTTVTIRVTLTTLDTGIALRNDHMRNKYLEVARFPDAVVTVPRTSLAIPAEGQSRSADVTGTLALHGVSRPVTLHYVASAKAGTLTVKGSTSFNMNDYGISVPTYLGITVRPKVDIDVSFAAVDG